MKTTKGWKLRRESDDKRVEGGWKVGRESDVGWRRVGWRKVGVVGLGHMARQEFAHGRSRW